MRCFDKISNKAQLSKVIKMDAQRAGIWLFWRDDGMKIDLVSSNFQASNCLVLCYCSSKEVKDVRCTFAPWVLSFPFFSFRICLSEHSA